MDFGKKRENQMDETHTTPPAKPLVEFDDFAKLELCAVAPAYSNAGSIPTPTNC